LIGDQECVWYDQAMTDSRERLNQMQFGRHADAFVTSAVHRAGQSLLRLVEVCQPQAEWRVLDIATGGGHTALAFAPFAGQVIASDLTHRMLLAARSHADTQEKSDRLTFVQCDGQRLPFADATLDCVTCRIAPHHFADVWGFIREVARVVRPGGVVGIVDNIAPGDPKAARYLNALERFRDPSHHWAHTLDDWRAFFFAAGLAVKHNETIQKKTDLDEWAARVGLVGDDAMRLRVLIVQAPATAREWLAPAVTGNRVQFTIREALIVGTKEG
jgi:ubiquinone/menaquinone biosynthesis C-methylase UbiE